MAIVVPNEPTDLMLAEGLRESIAVMKEYGVDGLSPFKDYPSPAEVTRRVYMAMVAAAPKAHDDLRDALTHKSVNVVSRRIRG